MPKDDDPRDVSASSVRRRRAANEPNRVSKAKGYLERADRYKSPEGESADEPRERHGLGQYVDGRSGPSASRRRHPKERYQPATNESLAANEDDDQNRLAQVERQLSELRGEVQELRRELRRLGGGAREQSAGEMQQGPAGDVPEIVLTVLVSAECPSQSEQAPLAMSGLTGELPGVRATDVLLRSTVVVHAPAERLREWDSGVRARAPLQEHADRLLNEVGERLAQQAAQTGLNPVWDTETTRWHVTDFGGFERAAEMFGGLDNWGHEAVGAWVKDVGGVIGIPDAVAGDVGEVIGFAIPLPIDRPLSALSRGIQVAGVVFAATTGNAPLFCASLKAMAHDRLIDFMAKRILGAVAGRGSDRDGPEQRPGRSRGRPGGSRSALESWRDRDALEQRPGRSPGRFGTSRSARELERDETRERTPADNELNPEPWSRESGF